MSVTIPTTDTSKGLSGVARMSLTVAAILTFIAMCLQDVIGTAMVIFESQFNWLLAGACDVTGYFFGLLCSVLALDSILKDGFWCRRSLVLIASVSLANFFGTALGVAITAHLTHH